MRVLTVLVAGLILPCAVLAKDPDCTSKGGYPASMAFVYLKNAGLTDNDKIDFAKTVVQRLASEKVGKDLYRQIHLVRFAELSGGSLEVITVNDASSVECSMSGVEIYVVARRLGER